MHDQTWWWLIENQPGFRWLTKSYCMQVFSFKASLAWKGVIFLHPSRWEYRTGLKWTLMSVLIEFWCQKAVSLLSHWGVHSAWPFTPAHNATKVWWLSNLLKQAPWQTYGFTPGPQSLYQRKLHPPQIPTPIKPTDDITVSPILKKKKKDPSGSPLLACAA